MLLITVTDSLTSGHMPEASQPGIGKDEMYKSELYIHLTLYYINQDTQGDKS